MYTFVYIRIHRVLYEMKDQIEKEIRKAINRHLVMHVQVPKEDGRCRVEILIDEAATEILRLLEKPKSNDPPET